MAINRAVTENSQARGDGGKDISHARMESLKPLFLPLAHARVMLVE
jgi:hypothetical protein